MRVAFFALLLANLLYMGWAEWIDVPAPPPQSSIAGLRPLTLVKELPPEKRAALARMEVQKTAPPLCVSVGPFADTGLAGKAAALLRAKSFTPRQRAVEVPAIRRFWVYLDGFSSDAAVTKALHKLEREGIDDAEAMPPEAGGRRISLGLFTDHDRADRRAKLVRAIGFRPATTERMLPGTVYWLDVTVPNGSAPLPLKDVSDLAPSGASSPVRMQSCPIPAAPAPAAPPPSSSPPEAQSASPARATPVPAPQNSSAARSPVAAAILPQCKPGGRGPVPCIVVKEAAQPSVL
ncbi:MAG: hypothetical protein ACRET2_13720 [Steroidobacteraceae bacterium]